MLEALEKQGDCEFLGRVEKSLIKKSPVAVGERASKVNTDEAGKEDGE